uniref:copper transport protein ATOX1 n=1 Tax=Myxine glutinosa TaxID=7769 RepID=UPI00358F2A2D
MASEHEFFVDMTCEGCSVAVARVLDKNGVQHSIDLPNKKVTVTTDLGADAVLASLKKIGKEVKYLGEK